MVVKDLSFTLGEGTVFGFLGLNGAGKTTTIRMLCTLIRPTSGTATITGFDILRQPSAVREAISIVPQQSLMDSELSVIQNLQFYSKLYRVSDRDSRIHDVVSFTELEDHLKKKMRELSGGYMKRAEIARALLSRPKIIFLDEPTTGLDPIARRKVWDMIRGLVKDQSTTIFLTTQYMEEAECLCDTVAIIDKGELKAMGKTNSIIKSIRGEWTLTIHTKDVVPLLKLSPPPMVVKDEGGDVEVKFRLRDHDDVVRTLSLFFREQLIESVDVKRPTLEDVFIRTITER